MAEKNYGLRLTVAGAPNTPHSVGQVPGLFRPDIPTPVGGPGELDLKFARELDADRSVPLELVDVKNVEKARTTAGDDLQQARGGILDAAGQRLADRERAKDEATNVKAAEANGGQG